MRREQAFEAYKNVEEVWDMSKVVCNLLKEEIHC